MILRTTLANNSSLALTVLLRRLKSFCDENNISYEVMVRLNRYLNANISHIIIDGQHQKSNRSVPNNIMSKQSKYYVVGRLPIISIILGPSGSSETVLLLLMIIYIGIAFFTHIHMLAIRRGRQLPDASQRIPSQII